MINEELCIKHTESLVRVETKIDTLVAANNQLLSIIERSQAFYFKLIIGTVGVLGSVTLAAFGLNQAVKFLG